LGKQRALKKGGLKRGKYFSLLLFLKSQEEEQVEYWKKNKNRMVCNEVLQEMKEGVTHCYPERPLFQLDTNKKIKKNTCARKNIG
jgi:hypothetical protein